jgi:hypothetical protein
VIRQECVGSVGTRVPMDLGPALGTWNRVGDPRPTIRDWQVCHQDDDLVGSANERDSPGECRLLDQSDEVQWHA